MIVLCYYLDHCYFHLLLSSVLLFYIFFLILVPSFYWLMLLSSLLLPVFLFFNLICFYHELGGNQAHSIEEKHSKLGLDYIIFSRYFTQKRNRSRQSLSPCSNTVHIIHLSLALPIADLSADFIEGHILAP